MGLIQELADLVKKLSFFAIVYEYQQGLYFSKGIVVEKRLKRIKPEKEKKLEAEERELIKEMGGYSAFLPFRRPELSEDKKSLYRLSRITGLPLHKDRFSKILQPGFYFNIPVLDDIIRASQQEKPLDLGNIDVTTTDDPPVAMTLSCNLIYELRDLSRAYINVDDYEGSLRIHALSLLSKFSRGKTLKEWTNPEVISTIERQTLVELRKKATYKWGLDVSDFIMTTGVPCSMQRLSYDGQPVKIHTTSIPLESPIL